MANPEHVKILKQGVEVWNVWRVENYPLVPDLSGANLREMFLSDVNLINVNLVEADLSSANLNWALLNQSHFMRANLSNAGLLLANLTEADFSFANLCNATLTKSNLSFASLHGANLNRASLEVATFNGTDISDADFREARIGWTTFDNVFLSLAKGLDTVRHVGPSSVGVDTIYKSRGNIPEAFLRGCGVPDQFITYMPSLTGKAIEFYSCFISYSSKDESFAERLHADLQNKGVRCWFAPEDLKIGDRFRDRIDESIRLHDKLLLILSENSVSSQWVSDEVEAAFEREQREDRTVLFPIRIDDAVMDSDKAWAAKIRRTRHVGDFTRWKEHDSYTKAFERLLRDLSTGS